MSAVARLVVRVAVRMLPSAMRDRYREQWGADLRDAEESGIPRSEIAWGSLAFAATVDRPLVSAGHAMTPSTVERRSRLAAALALSGALLGVLQWAYVANGPGGLTGNGLYDFLVMFAMGLLFAYMAVALVASVILVSTTRGIDARVRLAIWLLVAASFVDIARGVIDSGDGAVENIYLTPGMLAYLVAALIVIGASGLLWQAFRVPRIESSRRDVAFASLAVVVVGALCLAQSVVIWADRAPMDFGGANATVSMSATNASEWLAESRQFERSVEVLFIAWAIAALIVAGLVVLAVRGGQLRAAPLVAGVSCVMVVAHAALISYMHLTPATASAASLVPVDVMLLVGRWGLVAVVLYGVGEVRFERSKVVEAVAA